MKNKSKIISSFIILIIISFILLRYFFFYEKVVTDGTNYSFDIGMNKEEVISSIKLNYPDDILIILSPDVSMNDVSEIIYIDKNLLDYALVKDKNVWQIRFKASDTNVLVLRFDDDNLIEMTRYRRLFIP